MTDGQERARSQLREIERRTEAFEIVSLDRPSEDRKSLVASVSLQTGGLERVPEGLPLYERERIRIVIPADFPFSRPRAYAQHTRFAGFPHVQWARYLCLYLAPDVEWNPGDGIYGFVDRLWDWLRRGALDQLDPTGAPLHPPVTYASSDAPLIVPHADTPSVGDEPWLGLTHLRDKGEHRTDVVGWEPFPDEEQPELVGAAVLLPESMPFEFPKKAKSLFLELAERGVSMKELLPLLLLTVARNPEEAALYLLVGTPMRGIRGREERKQHLTAWRLDETASRSLRLALNITSDQEEIREIGEEGLDLFFDWTEDASIEWCRVQENRSEVTTRRDHDSPLSVFRGKTVSLWGCGALGAHVGLSLARAGVRKLVIRDNGRVTPGVLVRQPYGDADIGHPKVDALKSKLEAIRPDIEVDANHSDVLSSALNAEKSWTDESDFVIDCTASRIVRSKLEKIRHESNVEPVPATSMFISGDATRGMVVTANASHSGGPADVSRKAILQTFDERSLLPFADTFHPEHEDEERFQPEPGCSSPTFVGSAADTSALAGLMLNCAAESLRASQSRQNSERGDSQSSTIDIFEGQSDRFSFDRSPSAWAHMVTQPHAVEETDRSHPQFSWQPDLVSPDPRRGYDIRISRSAWDEMRAAIDQNKQKRSPKVETGGLLFGRRDDASKVIWVDEATGPPPESVHRRDLFVCGTEGTRAANEERKSRTRAAVQYVGMWHTHPESAPSPSEKDLAGMRKMLSSTCLAPSRALLTIIGTPHDSPSVGTYVFDRSDVDSFTDEQWRTDQTQRTPPVPPLKSRDNRDTGLALSGGGSRAIAFHLGCLRALREADLLHRVQVMSGVSGGAVIAAMYAYSEDSFSSFEDRVLRLLQDGLQADIARRALLSRRLLEAAGTNLTAGLLAYGTQALDAIASSAHDLIGSGSRIERPGWIEGLEPPFSRWRSWSTAFEDVLRSRLFGDKRLVDPRRKELNIVLNAAELRTGTAFRFGSSCSASWRQGRIKDNDVDVATAVAASAAYPAVLPALHRTFLLVNRDGETNRQNVVLTDGGVFDNLGVSCLEPDRSERYSYHVYDVDHLFCCSAGHGQWAGTEYPYGWKQRLQRAFGLLLKKQQDGAISRLFSHRQNGKFDSFVFPYLGQKDERLTDQLGENALPEDFVGREQVVGYPTDFRAMPEVDVRRITQRGELLTRLLLEAYGPPTAS